MKEGTQRLLLKAEDTIEAAELLVTGQKLSSAAGRAYYAMFYAAMALLYELGLEFGKHRSVHGAFGQNFAKTGKMDPKFHRYLLDAFETRLEADYDVDVALSTEVVEELIRRAKEFLAAARGYLGV